MSKGFASFSKQRRIAVSIKGGKAVQSKGVGHSYNAITAKAAAVKSVATRRKKRARVAAMKLMEIGFTSGQLHVLQLTEEELIYFGGSERSKIRLDELIKRLHDLEIIIDENTNTDNSAT